MQAQELKPTAKPWAVMRCDGVPLLESRLERVTDRNSEPVRVAGGEFVVVVDLVYMGFGAQENVVPNVETNAGAKMSVEMVAAHVISAAYECAVDLTVETKVFATKSNHQFRLYPLAKPGGIDGVKVIQDGTERKCVGIVILPGSPGYLTLDADLVMVQKEDIGADAGKKSAALRDNVVACDIQRA